MDPALPIAFLGGGNMATSLVRGLLDAGHHPGAIAVADPDAAQRERLSALGDLRVDSDNDAAVSGAKLVILAIKPQVLADVLGKLVVAADTTVLSIAAGWSTVSLADALGGHGRIVRCMPNTPALLGCGASALYAPPSAPRDALELAEAVMGCVGSTCRVDDEALMDVVTALSGSGPAYFFLFMEALRDRAVALGLEHSLATGLAAQTALGAARMALESGEDLAELRRRVTSPGGTTEAALHAFASAGLKTTVAEAVDAAWKRSRELAGDGQG